MSMKIGFILWIQFVIFIHPTTAGVSFNQPTFCSNALWNPNATTLAPNGTVGSVPYHIFINTDNTIYITISDLDLVQVWPAGSTNASRIISGNLDTPRGSFVTINGDVYVENGHNHRIDKWPLNATNGVFVINVTWECTGFFIDTNNVIYCSINDNNVVTATPISNGLSSIVAGNGSHGSASDMLNQPNGIFVDINFILYVADWGNNRIQQFQPGQLNGTTVLGNGAPETFTLSGPVAVTADGAGYLFIVDYYGNRIVGSGPNGYRCVIGCSGLAGSASDQLYYPRSLSFDSFGNIFVVDTGNSRIQKFMLATNSCDSITTTQEISINIEYECSSPMITLIPNDTSLITPIQFQRSEDFTIISMINVSCIQSLSFVTQWTIRNCTSSCESQINIDPSVITTMSELYIPSRILPYGIYQLNLTVIMNISSRLTSSKSVYVEIIQSNIIVNLIQFSNSFITYSYQDDLILNPGLYSIDPDSNTFDANNWNYTYYCQIDDSNTNETLMKIDDPYQSCFSNQSVGWTYGSTNTSKSSLIIFAGSLSINETYRFVVNMINRQNSNLKANGSLLVKISDRNVPIIAIDCLISSMCLYKYINPSTQLVLYSICIDNCTLIENIKWNIYQGIMNLSTNLIEWIEFLPLNDQYYGMNTSNLTIINNVFMEYSNISYWKFQVIYSFDLESSISEIEFQINKSPQNGSCLINPLNGTTSAYFTINCFNWFDENGIKDYSVSVYTTDPLKRMMIAYSIQSNIEVLLPADSNNISLVNVIIYIRDNLDSVTQFEINSVIVIPDWIAINTFVDVLQQSNIEMMNKNPIIELLASKNQNIIGQIITLLSQIFNLISNQQLEYVVTNAVPATSVSITSLTSIDPLISSTFMNTSTLTKFKQYLNEYANTRDYLIEYLVNLPITTLENIELQSSVLVQLTNAINQLTRTTCIIASTKSYQLSLILQSESTQISYEDIQTTAQWILQSAADAFCGINEPLQDRGLVLDLDLSRANTFPTDYDTDLESPWSNLNLFANGNDFSWETIEQGRNTYYQKQTANSIDIQFFETLSLITSAINNQLNLDQIMIIRTPSIYFYLEKILVQSLSNKFIQLNGNANIQFPAYLNLTIDNQQIISIRSIMLPLAPYGNSPSNSYTNLSTFISFSLIDQNENDIPIYTTINNPIELIIPRDINMIIPSMILQNVTFFNNSNQSFYLHFVNITTNNNLTISVHFEMYPINTSLAYFLIYKFDQIPQLNQIDGWTLFCPSNLTNDNLYTYFINNQQTYSHKYIIFGLRELNSTEMENFCLNNLSISNPMNHFNNSCNFSSNYELRIYTSGCFYLDLNNNWKSDGLMVGPLTNVTQTQCFSIYPTRIAASFHILPIPINWNYVFANSNFIKNKTIYLTIISACIIYIILMIYAGFQDKQDIEKIGITILPDNKKSNEYAYQIIVFTGHRKDSGTESKVHFIIYGENNKTNIRTFSDFHRKIFQRCGIDSFIMTVPKSLGVLNCIRIWHDNSGKDSSASWFLKYIIVRDLQTMERYYFICQKWLAVEIDDGSIERLLLVANEREKQEFANILPRKVYEKASDHHLWFSIFFRPPSNKFTRIQRCTCCFVLLFITMLFNILYYQQIDQSNIDNGLLLGPFYITYKQIYIGCIAELLSLIPSLLLVQFFRRIRQSSSHRKHCLTFPWWCLYLAYALSFISVGASIFFIVVRSIELGDLTVQKWLTSIIAGLFSSNFLTQPTQILCLTIFYMVCLSKKKNNIEIIDDEIDFGLAKNDEYQHSDRSFVVTHRVHPRVIRLNKSEIIEARNQHFKEKRMWSIIQEIYSYLFFLLILYSISYINCNNNTFFEVKHLRNYFLNIKYSSNDYTKISTINEYWNWLENCFVSNIRAQQWYNGDPPWNLNGFINDKSNRLIGWATMRQLRVKSSSCPVRSINFTCEGDYSLFNEEQNSFQPGWANQTRKNFSSSILNAFIYKSGDELNDYIYVGDYGTYSSGGYVYEFRGSLSEICQNVSELHQLKWIDQYTRAIIIQMSLYNPNIGMFISVTFLIEFLSSGKIFPSSRFEPFNIQSFISLNYLIIIIIYILFIIYFIIKEIQSLFHLKFSYFYQLWSLINISIIICSWAGVGVYIWRYYEAQRIGTLFQETNGYAYVNLQLASYINYIFNILLGFCCFFGTIKLLNLCRFSRRLSIFNDTLKHAGKSLICFMFMFMIIFMAFLSLFYQLFISKVLSCSTLLRTTVMLFQMIILKFDVNNLYKANVILGPICSCLFIFFVVFICMNMFTSIIINSFRTVKKNIKLTGNEDHQIFIYMIRKFLREIGIIKPNKLEYQEECDVQMKPQYYDPIESFPLVTDQLMELLYQMYLTYQCPKDKRPL